MSNEYIDGVSTAQAAGVTGIPKAPTSIGKDVMQKDPNTVFVSDMNQLREKAPEVWDKTLKTIAHSMLKKMERAGERLKQQIRKMVRGE